MRVLKFANRFDLFVTLDYDSKISHSNGVSDCLSFDIPALLNESGARVYGCNIGLFDDASRGVTAPMINYNIDGSYQKYV